MMFPLFYTLTEVTGIGLNVVKKTWLITAVNIAAFLLNFGLLYWLVPLLGARGAAMASATSFWVFMLIKTELSSRMWQKLPCRKIYTHTALCLILCLGYTYFGNTGNYYIFALIWLAGLIALTVKYKTPLSSALSVVKGRLNKKHSTQ